jgi:hypothetical protein
MLTDGPIDRPNVGLLTVAVAGGLLIPPNQTRETQLNLPISFLSPKLVSHLAIPAHAEWPKLLSLEGHGYHRDRVHQ